MKQLLSLARLIDAFNEGIGKAAAWLVLVAVLVSTLNALARYTLNIGSNAFLELQWYLYAAVFLLGAAWTLRRNEHIRIDVVVGRFSPRVHAWIDILGGVFFLVPLCTLILWAGIPFAVDAIQSGEVSSNAGGLILWPARLLIPVAFCLLLAQGCSEIIKRFAFLAGLIEASEFEKTGHHGPVPDQEPAATAS
ncbi:TRAP transporter small permease subunit [Azovibrio restrictus]|uniref:TRAP transporter small permease subunit n=1 Tax=Azovibrio restrictus TaxID=146938 RepID=UPI0026EE4120|nr:TRAP transporter small permease subunit [Azovibrio restrictus]MDD3483851.1 TRAP transporter small permease subunit [Azovibrio restrictus]